MKIEKELGTAQDLALTKKKKKKKNKPKNLTKELPH